MNAKIEEVENISLPDCNQMAPKQVHSVISRTLRILPEIIHMGLGDNFPKKKKNNKQEDFCKTLEDILLQHKQKIDCISIPHEQIQELDTSASFLRVTELA